MHHKILGFEWRREGRFFNHRGMFRVTSSKMLSYLATKRTLENVHRNIKLGEKGYGKCYESLRRERI